MHVYTCSDKTLAWGPKAAARSSSVKSCARTFPANRVSTAFFLEGSEWRMKRTNKSTTLCSEASDTTSMAWGREGSEREGKCHRLIECCASPLTFIQPSATGFWKRREERMASNTMNWLEASADILHKTHTLCTQNTHSLSTLNTHSHTLTLYTEHTLTLYTEHTLTHTHSLHRTHPHSLHRTHTHSLHRTHTHTHSLSTQNTHSLSTQNTHSLHRTHTHSLH